MSDRDERIMLLATWPTMSYFHIETISEVDLKTLFDNDEKYQFPRIKNNGPFICAKYHRGTNADGSKEKDKYVYYTDKGDVYHYYNNSDHDQYHYYIIMAREVIFEGQIVLEPVTIADRRFVSVIADGARSAIRFDVRNFYNFPEDVAKKIHELTTHSGVG